MRGSWLLVLCICLPAIAALPVAAGAQPACEGKLVAKAWSPTLSLLWTGRIQDPMAECIELEFRKAAGTVRQVQLSLDSEGGYTLAADRVIATLRKVRETHLLQTVVWHGSKCWSACVRVFLAGKRRSGALTSTWLFHEVGIWAYAGGKRYYTVDRSISDRVFQDYLAAGVTEAWLKRLYLLIPHSDYWQTGQNLWEDKSGIITHPLDNLVPRNTERPKY